MNSEPNTLTRFWADSSGFVVSVELILISTIAVIGLITGLSAIRTAIVSELADVADGVQDLNQSYQYNGISGSSYMTAGSNYEDAADANDNSCITFDVAPSDERPRQVLNPIPIDQAVSPATFATSNS